MAQYDPGTLASMNQRIIGSKMGSARTADMNMSFAAIQFNLGAYVGDLGFAQTTAAQLISIGALIAMVPPVVIALLAQRYIVRGLTLGAVKG